MCNCLIIIINMIKILSLFCIVLVVKGLYFSLSSRPQCLQIAPELGKTIKFFYDVSGETRDAITVDFMSLNGNNNFKLSGSSNDTILNGDTGMTVCFISTDGENKQVSVDFYSMDKAHIKQLALKSSMYELHAKFIEAGQNLKQIAKNQMFQEEKQIIHNQMIARNENTIKTFAVIKIIAIIAVALAQIYLIRNMLTKQNKYSPL